MPSESRERLPNVCMAHSVGHVGARRNPDLYGTQPVGGTRGKAPRGRAPRGSPDAPGGAPGGAEGAGEGQEGPPEDAAGTGGRQGRPWWRRIFS